MPEQYLEDRCEIQILGAQYGSRLRVLLEYEEEEIVEEKIEDQKTEEEE